MQKRGERRVEGGFVGEEEGRAEQRDHVLSESRNGETTSRRSRMTSSTSGDFSEGSMARMMGVRLSINDCVLSEKVCAVSRPTRNCPT